MQQEELESQQWQTTEKIWDGRMVTGLTEGSGRHTTGNISILIANLLAWPFISPGNGTGCFCLTLQFISLPSLLFSVLVCWLAGMGHINMFLYLLVFCQVLVTTSAPCHLKPRLVTDRLYCGTPHPYLHLCK